MTKNNINTHELLVRSNQQKENTIREAIAILEQRITSTTYSLTRNQDTLHFLRLQFEPSERETFGVIFLNNQHKVIAFEKLFFGTVAASTIYPREVAKRALHHNAVALIFVHNHPSGTATPSPADITITKQLATTLSLFDIRIIDHIIIGLCEHIAFCEHGSLRYALSAN